MNTPFVTAISFLLLSFATKPLVAHPDPLVDVNGNEVEASRDYYVVSLISGAGGGGLTLFRGRNELCPLDVIQLSSDLRRGTHAYKIVHCPSVCESCVSLCNDVGVSYDDNRRLALTKERAFAVVLFPADERSASCVS
ncbi:hypothetical protein WN944_014356 [Citrus x changshan-huyou]|uniref:Uncharacterized protein n=1 Tax=Citrus x changshan-huyou TaxID=2935761 RepID=A0AAP0M881_9ROSI